MKLASLFSGGKDSTLATYIADKEGHEISCLITVISENKESYMFHIPSIDKTKKQAEAMDVPLIVRETSGKKEKELEDLEWAIREAKEEYEVEGIVTGAVESVYQSSRIQKICDKLGLECFNPLWQKDQIEILEDLIKNKFEAIIVGVAGYPLDERWLGRKIDKKFVREVKELWDKYQLNPAGEGGEFESFVLYVPGLFKKRLEVKSFSDSGEGHSWVREVELG